MADKSAEPCLSLGAAPLGNLSAILSFGSLGLSWTTRRPLSGIAIDTWHWIVAWILLLILNLKPRSTGPSDNNENNINDSYNVRRTSPPSSRPGIASYLSAVLTQTQLRSTMDVSATATATATANAPAAPAPETTSDVSYYAGAAVTAACLLALLPFVISCKGLLLVQSAILLAREPRVPLDAVCLGRPLRLLVSKRRAVAVNWLLVLLAISLAMRTGSLVTIGVFAAEAPSQGDCERGFKDTDNVNDLCPLVVSMRLLEVIMSMIYFVGASRLLPHMGYAAHARACLAGGKLLGGFLSREIERECFEVIRGMSRLSMSAQGPMLSITLG